MSDVLTRMIQRHRGAIPVIQPRQPSRFAQNPGGLEHEEQESSRSANGRSLVWHQEISEALSSGRQENPLSKMGRDRHEPTIQLVPPHHEPIEPRAMPHFQSSSTGQASTTRTFEEPGVVVKARSLFVHQPPPETQTDQSHAVPRGAPLDPLHLSAIREAVNQPPQVTRSELPHAASQQGAHIGTHASGIPGTDMQPFAESPRSALVPLPRLVPQDEAEARHPVRESSSAPTPLTSRTRMEREATFPSREPAEPPVQVTIGRIEVSAVTATPSPSRKTPVRQPSMGLQEYLSRRQGRGA